MHKKVKPIPWSRCEFAKYRPEQAFFKFFSQIEKIEVSHPKVHKIWNSLARFEAWLREIVNGITK